jgi:plastocyanin
VGVTAVKNSTSSSAIIASTSTISNGYYTSPQSSQSASVVYTADGFSPAILTIQSGTIVIFQNQSPSQFWPASDPNPSHTGYPVPGPCDTSAFDSCAPIAAGTSWSLRFDKTGVWGYHNHLNPSHIGTIIVK